MKRLLPPLLALLVLVAGCGSDKASGPASLAPADAFVYGEVDLAPEGDTRAAVNSLISKFPGSGDPGQRIQRLLELAFEQSKSGLSYEADVKPWLGDRAAFFGSGIGKDGSLKDAAALIATDDEGKAEDTIEKAAKGSKGRSYKRRDYRLVEGSMSSAYYEGGHPPLAAGVVDGFVVAGTEGGFKRAVDVAEGDGAIDGSDRYENAIDKADTDGLAFFYVSIEGLLKSAEGIPSSLVGPYRRIFKEPYVATVDADTQGVVFSTLLSRDAAAALGPFFGQGTELLGQLPGDSWLALGQPKLGELLGSYVDLFAAQLGGRATVEKLLRNATGLDLDRDLLDWMDDFGLFVRGERLSELSGALVIETSDEVASRRALAALEKALRRQRGGVSVGRLSVPGGEGFTIETGDGVEPIQLVVRDGKVVIGYGDRAVKDAFEPSSLLANDSGFRESAAMLGSDYEASFYAAVAPIFALIENEVTDPGVAEAKPYVEPFESIIGGTKRDGDKLESRSRITVR